MITYKTNPETGQLELVQEPPFIPKAGPEEILCFLPKPCPHCGC